MADATRRTLPERAPSPLAAALPPGARESAEVSARLDALLATLPADDPAQRELRDAASTLRRLGDDVAAARQRSLAILNALPDAVTLHDLDGRILDANDAAGRIYGRTREQLIGMSVRDLNPEVSPDRMAQVLREHALGESFVVQTTNVRADGTRFPAEVHSAVFLDRGQLRVIAIARDVSTRQHAELTLRDSEARYRQLLQAMDKGLMIQDHTGRVLSVNPAACRILGMEEAQLLDDSMTLEQWRVVDENGAGVAWNQMPALRALNEKRAIESTVLGVHNPTRRGYVWLSVTSVPQFQPGSEEPFQVISTFGDVTELKRDSALFAQTQTLARIGGWEWSPSRAFMYWTDELYRILQRTPGEKIAFERFIEHVEPSDRLRVQTVLHDALLHGRDFELECRVRTARGEPRWVRLLGRGATGKGDSQRVSGTLQDISESKQQQEQLRRQALTDPLTGLANRDAALEELGRALEHAGPERGPAVLYVDLDRFKVINDLLGHAAGDALLAAAGRRLQEAAGEYGLVARFGGDEFLVLMPQTLRGVAPMALAEHIAQVFGRAFEYGGEEFTLTASIGLARYPDDGVTQQQLINNADAAMSDAKRRGRNTWQRFNPTLAQQQSERLLIETQLRRALDNQELSLVYQPQVGLRDGHVRSAEALLRWNNRVLGDMRPDRFIQHAETTGDIVRIGAWVVREACRQLREWRAMGLDLPRIAVNVSFRQFLSEDFAQIVISALREFELAGDSLELEITERVVIEDAPDTLETFTALKALGVTVTIDDFGEGYSALNYLRRLPIDGLKISHTFMQGVPHNRSDADICIAIIRIAQSLGLYVIAEGVETTEQREFLLALGTELCQGYYYSRPLPPAEFEQYLRARLESPD
jgi:diguanylate cyclase (GGDEF)-like protein/PAS domain S-box-containing protein